MKTELSERKYAAFISYRHVWPDKAIAKALQLMLEYNLVRPDKSVPRHIRPVFLDVSELPLVEDLDEGIIRALDNSECLFVICSPDLPKSKYCMREISYFKEKHGGSLGRVGTLLVRGEPRESYPQLLRTKTVRDPENPEKTTEVEVEPLFADVRGKGFLHSLWKLFTTEYLRLAAKYYGCNYDALRKRHRRNLIGMITAVIMSAGIVTGVVMHKDHQMRVTQANAYASYAAEQTKAENELLALALCTHTACEDTETFETALRSAVVQMDYKQNGMPVAKTMETPYFHERFTNYYLSADGRALVVADGKIWQVTDSRSGAVLHQIPYEAAFVIGSSPSTYVMIESHPDDQGIFRDYVQLMDLQTNQLLSEFAFREASKDYPNYKVQSYVGVDSLLMVTDRGQPVAYFTSDGRQLTGEEFEQLVLQYRDAPAPEETAPYRLVMDKRRKEYAVTDDQGNRLLYLGKSYSNAAFCDDWTIFACAAEDILSVYDTENWNCIGQAKLRGDQLQSLQLLRGSSYCVAGYRGDTGTRSVVIDWRSGEELLQTDGSVLISPTEQAIFVVIDGRISRYSYKDLQTDRAGQVLAHCAGRVLSRQEGSILLRDSQSQEILMQTAARTAVCDDELEHILLSSPDGLHCYDGSGNSLWSLPVDAQQCAISSDGSLGAYTDEQGEIHVIRIADGTEVYQVGETALQAAGQVSSLLVSAEGIAAIGGKQTLWIPRESARPTELGSFTDGKLYANGLLILESRARVGDFLLYDTLKDYRYAPPADNTGAWAYSDRSGYLVRHIQVSGNSPSLYLEVWKQEKDALRFLGKIDLPETRVEYLSLDSTGAYLSFTSGGRSCVYRLKDLTPVLDAKGQIYYEAEGLFGRLVYGTYQYAADMADVPALLLRAQDYLAGHMAPRVLTEEEIVRYAIS